MGLKIKQVLKTDEIKFKKKENTDVCHNLRRASLSA